MGMQYVKGNSDDPNDVVSARKLDLHKVRRNLENRGIEVVFLDQIWRHVHGKVRVGKKECFLKMATTRGISKATRNECVWNNHFLTHTNGKRYFVVPQVFSKHNLDGKFFFLAEYFEARELCVNRLKSDFNQLRKQLPNIVDGMLQIDELPSRHFKWDSRYKFEANRGNKFFERAVAFSSAIGSPKVLTPLLEIAARLKSGYMAGLNHGDMAPWHLLVDSQNRLILTDSEWGSSCLPRFYDLAYCYQRLCGCVGKFEIAASLAGLFRKQLGKSDKGVFDRLFRSILAERCIGGYWDYRAGKNTASGTAKFHQRLRSQILLNDLY